MNHPDAPGAERLGPVMLRDFQIGIELGQTLELWTIPRSDNPEPQPVSFHCSTCEDPDNSRLLFVVIRVASVVADRPTTQRSTRGSVRMVLHVTRAQIEEIRASFGRQDNASSLVDVLLHKGECDSMDENSRHPGTFEHSAGEEESND
jgi:hypothetical protein